MKRLCELFAIPLIVSGILALVFVFQDDFSFRWVLDWFKAACALAPVLSAIAQYVLIERWMRPELRVFSPKPKTLEEKVAEQKIDVDKFVSEQLSALKRADAVLQERISNRSRSPSK